MTINCDNTQSDNTGIVLQLHLYLYSEGSADDDSQPRKHPIKLNIY